MGRRKTAQFAEHTFARLCADFGATCNKSQDDVNGWDYIVEFPEERNSLSVPADMLPAGKISLVQVKSVTTGELRTRVKLSNALKFCKSHLPCFIIMFAYRQDNGDDAGVFVVHFWKELIARTIKEVRRLDAEGKSDLHKRHLYIKFSESDAVSGNVLVNLSGEIDRVGKSYALDKINILKTVGYEDGFGFGEIAFGNGVTIEDIVDAQLGLRDGLDISQFSFRDARFGIPSRIPMVDSRGGKLFISPTKTRECTVVVSSETGGEGEIALKGELIAPAWPSLPEEYRKLRIKAGGFLDIVVNFSSGRGTINVNFNFSEKLPIDQITKFVAVRTIMGSSERLDCQVWVQEKMLMGAAMAIPKMDGNLPWILVSDFLSYIYKNIPLEKIPAGLALSIEDFSGAWWVISNFMQVVSGEDISMSSKVERNRLSFGDNGKVVYAGSVAIGNFSLFSIVSRDFRVESVNGNDVLFRLGAASHYSSYVLIGEKEQHWNFVRRELERRGAAMERVMPSEKIFTLFIDVMEICNGNDGDHTDVVAALE